LIIALSKRGQARLLLTFVINRGNGRRAAYRKDGDYQAFLKAIGHACIEVPQHYRSSGHIWQGRFKAFPIQEDEHLLTVLRYIERNPVRANLAPGAGARRSGTPLGPRERRRTWVCRPRCARAGDLARAARLMLINKRACPFFPSVAPVERLALPAPAKNAVRRSAVVAEWD